MSLGCPRYIGPEIFTPGGVKKLSSVIQKVYLIVSKPDPDEWELGTDDLRFYYALGVTYGMNDRSQSEEESSEPELTESA